MQVKKLKDGYEQMKTIFEETSLNEKEHAKIWFKLLHNNEMPSNRKLKKMLQC